MNMSKTPAEMCNVSGEARVRQRVLQRWRSSNIVLLPSLIVLGMASAVAFSGAVQSASSPTIDATASSEVRVRKSVTALTDVERKDFVDAVVALKRAPSPYNRALNYYDQFVQWHKDRYPCHPVDHGTTSDPMLMIHTGPMFLPWHRELIRRFEDALREVSGKAITLPYWDWTDPESVNPDNMRSVFREDFMGGDGDPDDMFAVKTGPFKRNAWTLKIHPEGVQWAPSTTTFLTRRLGRAPALPTKEEVEKALAAGEFDVPPYNSTSDRIKSFRNALEGEWGSGMMKCGPDGWMGLFPVEATPLAAISTRTTMHNLVHGWVGGVLSPSDARTKIRGTMLLPTSPNDPVFFLHHANIDRLWAAWQATHPGKTYEPKSGYAGNNADTPMAPFGAVTPQQVEAIKDLGYRYR
jgi:tyrosinase